MYIPLLIVIASVFQVASSSHHDPGLGTRTMISFMPKSAESVLLVRPKELSKTGYSGCSEFLVNAEEAVEDTLDVVLGAAASVGIDAVACAGSRFSRPAGLGVGEFTQYWAVSTASELTSLTDALESRTPELGIVNTVSIAGTHVFIGKSRMRSTRREPAEIFIAVPDSRLLLIASDLLGIEEMLLRRLKGAVVPAQWRELARRVDLASPLVLLRQYDVANERDLLSPWNAPSNDGNIVRLHAIGGHLVASTGLFILHGEAENAEEAMGFLSRRIFSAAWFEWDRKRVAGPFFRAELNPRDTVMEAEVAISCYMAFGMNLGI
jgi:hypothetical protein